MKTGLWKSALGCAAYSSMVMRFICEKLGFHLQSSNRDLAASLTIVKKELSKSTPGCAAYSSKVMRVIREKFGLHLQSSNRVLALSHRRIGTFRVYPWMCRMLPKSHMGCPQELGLDLQLSNRVRAPSLTIAKKGLWKSTPGCAVYSSKVMWVICKKLGLHLQSSIRVLAASSTIGEMEISESTSGCASCSPRVIWIVHGELGLHLQSSNRVLSLSLTIVEKRLYEFTPGCAACSPRVMYLIQEDLGCYFQSSNWVLSPSLTYHEKIFQSLPLDIPHALWGSYGLLGRTLAGTFKICPPPAWPPVSRNLFLLHAFCHCTPEVCRIGIWIVLTLLKVHFGVQDIQLYNTSSF